MTNNLVDVLLAEVDEHDIPDSHIWARERNFDISDVVNTIKSLSGNFVIDTEINTMMCWQCTTEGEVVAKEGSSEIRLLKLLLQSPEKTYKMPEIEAKLGAENAKVGFSYCMKNKWVKFDKPNNAVVATVSEAASDTTQGLLQQLEKITDPKVLQDLKKRKLIDQVARKTFKIKKGTKFTRVLVKKEADVTSDFLKGDKWKSVELKDYNFTCKGATLERGHLHPLLKVRQEFKEIFLDMGFEEMDTMQYVESSFWNFDTLFQPQQHPARDMHDTFFMSDPAVTTDFPPELVQKVKDVHENGGYGSIGYRYNWKIEEAQKNILRTHTTAVSSRYLFKEIANKKPFQPRKFFSIDKVFRNETMDATHLAEFHQVEGMIVGQNLHVGHLIGLFSTFFGKLGMTDLRFKPAYNPYTEPSMEIFAYSKELGRYLEVGNSGIFRPEMLLPLGVPEDVTVLAWGLSLERPTMIKYGISNIRDLVGHKVDLELIRTNPICDLTVKH